MRFTGLLIAILAFTTQPLMASVLHDLQVRTTALEAVSGTFRQTRNIAVLPLPLTSSGVFSYEQQRGLRWETLNPVKRVLTIAGEAQQPSTGSAPQAVISNLLLGMFSGDFSTLVELFTIEETSGHNGWQLQLTPKNKSMANQLQSIRLQGSDFTEQVTIIETSGDTTHITFTVNAHSSDLH